MIALVMVIVCGLMILPVLEYAQSVSRQSRVLQVKTTRVEAVKGGLRTALADPINLYKACDLAGLTVPVTLASPGLTTSVTTQCWKMDSTHAEDPATLRYGVGTTQVGALVPAGTIGTTMPSSGGSPAQQWRNDTTETPTNDKMWLPQLPDRHNSLRSPVGFSMPAGYPLCTVYFPGTYQDPIVIDGAVPVFFTSGIYYFENEVRISGSADVVVGGGAVEGCTNDQNAAFYAVNAPAVHNISGLGTTFVLGGAGRLVVDTVTSGTGPRLVFNKRYVGPADVNSTASAGVSIVSVNGELAGANLVDLDRPGTLFVPASVVGGDTPAPASKGYRPSTLVTGVVDQVRGRFVRIQLASAIDPLSLAEVRVNGIASNGTVGEFAQGRTATQSTTDFSGTPDRAVDGNTDGVFNNGSVTHTSGSADPNPWWQVDLGERIDVSEVLIHNRSDCCAARLQNFTVFVSDTDMTGRSYADLLADTGVAQFTHVPQAAAVTSIPFGVVSGSAPPPIVDINLTTAAPVLVEIPGHISVPQGRVVVNTTAGVEAGKSVSLGGGILAATLEVSPARPATTALGLVNPIVMHTLKIVSTTTAGTPLVTSTAIVQVKENGAYAVNSWATQ